MESNTSVPMILGAFYLPKLKDTDALNIICSG